MKIIERIYNYLDFKKIKPSEFERICGISNGYLGKQHKRLSDIGESILIAIIENYPDINPLWLVMGKGKMLQSEEQENISSETTRLFLKTIQKQAEEIGQLKQQILDLKDRRQRMSDAENADVAAVG